MNNKIKGKIYAIRSHQIDEIYIGSTTQPLSRRFSNHKHYGKGCTSSKILAFPDAYIELIENVEVNSLEELKKIEGNHIRNTSNCVNKVIAGRTIKEWHTDNREKLKKYLKEYYIKNKIIMIEQMRKNRARYKQALQQPEIKQLYIQLKQKIQAFNENNKIDIHLPEPKKYEELDEIINQFENEKIPVENKIDFSEMDAIIEKLEQLEQLEQLENSKN